MTDQPDDLVTEGRSPYHDLDTRSVREILHLMNQEDQTVPRAVAREIPQIEKAVHLIVHSFQQEGRLFYVGAGTSGRLGVLDASECGPTFGVDVSLVQGVIAGGDKALRVALEGIEDRSDEGAWDVRERGVRANDTVVGIAASGRTPYVIGALQEANRVGAATIALVCNPDAPMADIARVTIAPVVGSEVLMGSTRLKAGTAQKLVLNMLSTTAMIQMGKVYSNLMVDVQATNEKLKQRARRIVEIATGTDADKAADALARAGGRAKVAIVMMLVGCDETTAEKLLHRASGFVRKALELAGNNSSESN